MRNCINFIVLTFVVFSSACKNSHQKENSPKPGPQKTLRQITFIARPDSMYLHKTSKGFTGFGYKILYAFASKNNFKLKVLSCPSDPEVYARMLKNEGEICITRGKVYKTANKDFTHSSPIHSKVDTNLFNRNFDVQALRFSPSNFFFQKDSFNLIEHLYKTQCKKKDVLINVCFTLSKKHPELRSQLDSFLKAYTKTSSFKLLKYHWFEEKKQISLLRFKIPRMLNGAISPYDPLFKSVSQKYAWDWRLLAAVCFKESRFNPNARGAGGAFGLMQFMPRTGRSYGISTSSPPEIQVMGGMKLLNKLYQAWSGIPDIEQRTKFTLASYNGGIGHVIDAQKLAVKYGYNPLLWDGHVQLMVANLSKPVFYNDPLVKSGAYRGHADRYANIVYLIYESWKE